MDRQNATEEETRYKRSADDFREEREQLKRQSANAEMRKSQIAGSQNECSVPDNEGDAARKQTLALFRESGRRRTLEIYEPYRSGVFVLGQEKGVKKRVQDYLAEAQSGKDEEQDEDGFLENGTKRSAFAEDGARQSAKGAREKDGGKSNRSPRKNLIILLFVVIAIAVAAFITGLWWLIPVGIFGPAFAFVVWMFVSANRERRMQENVLKSGKVTTAMITRVFRDERDNPWDGWDYYCISYSYADENGKEHTGVFEGSVPGYTSLTEFDTIPVCFSGRHSLPLASFPKKKS